MTPMDLLAAMTAHGWSPGPGDPTFMGWLITGCYFVAAFLAFAAARVEKRALSTSGPPLVPRFWIIAGVAMLILGINKELDLHTAVTLFGRQLARSQGWYAQRRPVQLLFVITVGLLAFAALSTGLWLLRRSWRRYAVALIGLLSLVAFIVIRAASFHHVDVFLRHEIRGMRLHKYIELAGIVLVALAAARSLLHHRRLVRHQP